MPPFGAPARSKITRGIEGLRNLDVAPAPQVDTKAVLDKVRQIANRHVEQRREQTEQQPDTQKVPTSAGVFSTWEEWRRVRNAFFPRDGASDAARDAGVTNGSSMVAAWRCRERPESGLRVPRYVEATQLIAEAQTLDRSLMAEPVSPAVKSTGPSPSCVSVAYGGAISRAVHVLTGGLIRSGSYMDEDTTYRERATQIGLPEEAVEVRRRCAHGGMPLLTELRFAAAMIMQYLFEVYWTAQEGEITALVAMDKGPSGRAAKGGRAAKRNRDGASSGGRTPENEARDLIKRFQKPAK